MNQANVTARLLGYLRHLMNADPEVRKAHLKGPEYLQVSLQAKGGELVAFLRTDRSGALPPLRVPVPLLAEDTQSGYNEVRRCVLGWLEANKKAIRSPERSNPTKDNEIRTAGRLGN